MEFYRLGLMFTVSGQVSGSTKKGDQAFSLVDQGYFFEMLVAYVCACVHMCM